MPRAPYTPEEFAVRLADPLPLWRGLCRDCLKTLEQQEERAKIDPKSRANQYAPTYIWRGKPFTQIEYRILRALEQNMGHPVSAKILSLLVYGARFQLPLHATRQRVLILRKKLESSGIPYEIQRIGRRGYQLVRRKEAARE